MGGCGHTSGLIIMYYEVEWICTKQNLPSLPFSHHTYYTTYITPCSEDIMDWVEDVFVRIGLEVYHHNYSAIRPAVFGHQVHIIYVVQFFR